MNNSKLTLVSLSAGLSVLVAANLAQAQEATAQASGQAQVGMGLPGATPQTTAVAAPAVGYGGTDHARVVGHLGVGYLGRSDIQVGNGGGGATLQAPVIGVRYWMNPRLGLDLGLGLAIQGGSTQAGGTTTDSPSLWALVLHGGVPLALATGQHYTFEIIPEANIGFGGGSNDANSYRGFLLDLGARAGAEIQFGFIGLPELALQGSVGLLFSTTSASTTPDGGAKSSTSSTSLRTTVYSSPWGIFTNSITALYYF